MCELIQRFNSILFREIFRVEDETDTYQSSLYLFIVFFYPEIFTAGYQIKSNQIYLWHKNTNTSERK